jgi:RNA polymerase sigma factor (sigma-70 family)
MIQGDASQPPPAERETVDLVEFAEYFDDRRVQDLQRFVRSQCQDADLAEEVAQNVLVLALASWPKVGAYDNPMGWVIKAARFKLKHALRLAAAQRNHVRSLDVVVNEPCHEPINAAEAEIVLFKLMSRLSQRQSEIWALTWLEFTDQEIAQLLEITPSTVRSHRDEARRRLQALMDEEITVGKGR